MKNRHRRGLGSEPKTNKQNTQKFQTEAKEDPTEQ